MSLNNTLNQTCVAHGNEFLNKRVIVRRIKKTTNAKSGPLLRLTGKNNDMCLLSTRWAYDGVQSCINLMNSMR